VNSFAANEFPHSLSRFLRWLLSLALQGRCCFCRRQPHADNRRAPHGGIVRHRCSPTHAALLEGRRPGGRAGGGPRAVVAVQPLRILTRSKGVHERRQTTFSVVCACRNAIHGVSALAQAAWIPPAAQMSPAIRDVAEGMSLWPRHMPWTVYQKSMPCGMATTGADAGCCACHRKPKTSLTPIVILPGTAINYREARELEPEGHAPSWPRAAWRHCSPQMRTDARRSGCRHAAARRICTAEVGQAGPCPPSPLDLCLLPLDRLLFYHEPHERQRQQGARRA